MLSDRQVLLLDAIIQEYINSTIPVGSAMIVQKYKIHCSPATVRNEMAQLIDTGFLKMLHSSSGRVPTSMAYRFYLDQIMEEDELPVLQEIAMKQRLWPVRFEFDKLLRQTAVSLSDITKEAAFITTNDGYVINAGAVNLLDNQEYWNIESAKAALHLLDRYELLEQTFEKAPYGGEVRFVIGEEFGNKDLEQSCLIFSKYTMGSKSGYIGVLGPARLRYSNVVPTVKYTKRLLEELGGSW